MRGTGAVAALLDIAAAAMALILSPSRARLEAAPPAAAPLWPGPRAGRLLAATCLAGAILLALEVVWVRFLLLFLSGTSAAFASMLAVVLVGIAAGSFAASLWAGRDPSAHRWLPGLALLAGLASVLAYITFDRALDLAGAEYTETARAVFLESIWLMLPVCALSGLLFTLMGRALRDLVPDAARAAGLLTLANTTGAMIGAPLAGFALLPGLGMERSFFALAAAYGAVAVLPGRRGRRARDARGRSGCSWGAARPRSRCSWPCSRSASRTGGTSGGSCSGSPPTAPVPSRSWKASRRRSSSCARTSSASRSSTGSSPTASPCRGRG